MKNGKQAAAMPAENGLRIELTSEIVAAYVANNPVPASDLPDLIASVWKSLNRVLNNDVQAEAEKPVPAVPIRKSVTPDYIVSLEDGKKFKSLKRALMTRYGMTPDEYRAKWGLPASYPMVAPNYAALRSKLAREAGLGRKPAPPPKRGRKKAS